jgi:hypothetical protein
LAGRLDRELPFANGNRHAGRGFRVMDYDSYFANALARLPDERR